MKTSNQFPITQNQKTMKTSHFFKTLFSALTLMLFLASGCNKDENDFLPTNDPQAGISGSNEVRLATLEDTLNMLIKENRSRELHTDYLNEMPSANAKIMGIERIKVIDPHSNEFKEFEAQIIDGQLIAEGDMKFGTEAQFRARLNRAQSRGAIAEAESMRWSNGVIPYTIAANHVKNSEILEAIDRVNTETNLTITPRTNESDYVNFPITDELNSWVGKQGGVQSININENASVGNIIHEIFHAAGMMHEQSRCDRDAYVTILSGNIEEDAMSNFDKSCSDSELVGNYNYSSIMHYGAYFFSKNNSPTIIPTYNFWDGWSGFVAKFYAMGQRKNIADTDKEALKALYPITSGKYIFKPRHSAHPLFAAGSKGEVVKQSSLALLADQKFELLSAGNGYYYIKHVTSGYYLSVSARSTANGAKITLWNYEGRTHQQFKFEKISGNLYKIRVRNSGRYLDIKGKSTWIGAELQQWGYGGGTNQQFYLTTTS